MCTSRSRSFSLQPSESVTVGHYSTRAIECFNDNGETPLLKACEAGQTETVVRCVRGLTFSEKGLAARGNVRERLHNDSRRNRDIQTLGI
jgi:hypothetical protein